MKRQRLRMRKLTALAVVDRPDNPTATVAVLKRAPETFAGVRAGRAARDELYQFTHDFADSVDRILSADDVEDAGALVERSLAEFVAAVKAALPGWLAAVAKREQPEPDAEEAVRKLFRALAAAAGG